MPVNTLSVVPARRTTVKISQAHLCFYWSAKRVTERFEQIIRTSDAVSLERGPLTLPALKGRP